MLYLKSMVLDKFKSFRHAELLFSKGFTCIVGPNGSGKSVIFDALMFGLGEPSLQMLRVDRLEELINRNVKRKRGEPTIAYLRMQFEGDGKSVTVVKAIRSDGKTMYRLDGKKMSRKEIIEFLSSEGVRVDDTTTIAQGEITAIGKMNSRQRRSLIDTAAGISEFEDKKAEAMKELGKVDQKISEANVALRERQGFLNGLEKEKEAAESYVKMSQRMKCLRYSVLVSRKDGLKLSKDGSSKELAILDSKKNESLNRLNESKSKRDQLTEERQQLTKELAKVTSASSETTSRLETLGRELARLEVEVPAIKKAMDEGKAAAGASEAELEAAKAKAKSNASSIAELDRKVAALEKDLAKLGAIPEEGVDYDRELSGAEAAITEAENRLVDVQAYVSSLQAELSVAASKRSELEARAAGAGRELEALSAKREAADSGISGTKQRIAEMADAAAKIDQERRRLGKRLYEIDGERISMSDQRARLQSREGNLSPKISERFSEKDGFYGKASSLCKYSGENAYAVEVSAGSRFDYFVVDSMASANAIIDYLKKNGLGRATFIPIEEIRAERQESEEDGLKPVIDVVKFDRRFSKVFSYIFSNTFIVGSAADAKRYGIGRHRYVTLEGELVEQSGTISGGSARKGMSLSSVENRIKELEEERGKTTKALEMAEKGLHDAEREKALLEIQLAALDSQSKSLREESSRLSGLGSELELQAKALAAGEAKAKKEMEAKDKEKLGIVSSLDSGRQARNAIYEKVSAASKGFRKSAEYKEAKERSDRIRNEIEAGRVSCASLSTEMQMLEKKASELSAAIAERRKQANEAKSQLAEKELRRDVLLKAKGSIEGEMKDKNESSKKLYDRLGSIDSEVSGLSTEIGRLDSEVAGFERQIGELKVRVGQADTRLNDITAELATYPQGMELVRGKPEEMEAEANVISGRISALGNVNLKAPEVYEEKKKLTEEAQGKVATLQAEKDAVLRMMEEIDSKKLQTFMEMLNEVNKNFGRLYNVVFAGRATIALESESDPLNSGIEIRANDGKSDIPVKGLSGGQQSMIALMLLLSIHMCKKSSIYLFDEVDAALDSENAKKLSRLVKQMSTDAQYIVISHNNSLIVNADTAIGVTIDETKESKAIGLEISSMIGAKQQQ